MTFHDTYISQATQVQDIIYCASLQFGEIISNQVVKKLKTTLTMIPNHTVPAFRPFLR